MSVWSAAAARRVPAAALVVLCSTLLALPAGAQVRPRPAPAPAGPAPRAGSWEAGGGVAFGGGFDLGDAAADLTRNTSGAATGPFTQFVTAGDLGSAPGIEGRLAYYFTRRFAVEGGVSFSRPSLAYEISGDTEGAPDVTAEESLDRYLFTGSALWHFGRPAARTVPFIFGGAGYLRELHEGQELVETGTEYHAGAGVKVWFGNARRRVGLRGDAGVSFREGGVDAEDGFRTVPLAAGSVIFLF